MRRLAHLPAGPLLAVAVLAAYIVLTALAVQP